YLQEQAAADGSDVKQGDLLYRIAPEDYQAALDQAKAEIERDTATLDYARSNLGRGTELAKSGYLAKDSFDQRTSTLRAAEAALAVDRAALRTAELNLGYAEI
ncbi:MAG: biotin/lipoyl-binding protein, partial [Mesorhizobium sp.]